MKTGTKVLLTAVCAVALVAASVFGTLAYLTSSDTVTNTFTVGNVVITMDEAPVDADGKATSGARVKANEYKLIPGKSYDKDPTIYVDTNSEDCWVFVKIVNEIAAIEGDTTVAAQMAANWTAVEGADDVYAYNDKATAGNNIAVFKGFTVKGEVDGATLAGYEGKSIVVTAYAIQADGFDTAAAAWAAAGGDFTK